MSKAFTRDPLEAEFIRICKTYGIKYDRPERYPKDKPRPLGNIDFYLPDFNVGVEVKAWSCERMVQQLEGKTGIIVLIGMEAIRGFARLIAGIDPVEVPF